MLGRLELASLWNTCFLSLSLSPFFFACRLLYQYTPMIILSLSFSKFWYFNRYWVTEMHVDGFRFDLASILTRSSRYSAIHYVMFNLFGVSVWFSIFLPSSCDLPSLWDAANVYGKSVEGDTLTTGSPLSSPPLIDMISNDPILRGVKVMWVILFVSFLLLLWQGWEQTNEICQ